MKNINYGESNHNRTRSSVFMHTITPSVTIQGNITAMRFEMTSFSRFVFLIYVPVSVWCWHGITHHVTWLEVH